MNATPENAAQQVSLKEAIGALPKVEELIREFKLLPPTTQTYLEIEEIVSRGLPFVKSISPEAATHLLTEGSMRPESERVGDGFDVIYASVLRNHGYGPLTLRLSPQVMKEGRFKAYCIDRASPYLQKQVGEQMGSIHGKDMDQLSAESIVIEQVLLEKYTLTPQEFLFFFSYSIASLYDNQDEYGAQDFEERLRYLHFEFGLPAIDLKDIEEVIYKEGWGEEKVDEQGISMLCGKESISFRTIENQDNGSSTIDRHEKTITTDFMEQSKIPQQYQETIIRLT